MSLLVAGLATTVTAVAGAMARTEDRRVQLLAFSIPFALVALLIVLAAFFGAFDEYA